jgi:GxxExxY protein
VAIVYREESYKIMGACFEVYREMGCGFLEAVYQECLEIEFELQGIPIAPRGDLILSYKNRRLKQTYIPDFVVFDKIILEIKALSGLTGEHRSQVHNYLKATSFKLDDHFANDRAVPVGLGKSGRLRQTGRPSSLVPWARMPTCLTPVRPRSLWTAKLASGSRL